MPVAGERLGPYQVVSRLDREVEEMARRRPLFDDVRSRWRTRAPCRTPTCFPPS
jgi:hypothetical protein